MGIQKNIPNIKPGDWTSVRQVISRLALRIGPESTPTFSGLTLTDLTATRLLQSDGSKSLTSVSDLTDWIAGTANEINVIDDGDGTVTIGLVDPLIVSKGGTGLATLTNHGILLGSGTDAITPLGIAANGQIPIGKAIPEGWLGISSGEYDSHCGDSYDHNLTEALDGTDYWAHSGNEVHWFILDLGTTYYITKVRGRSNGGSFDPVDIDIFISDDKENWGDAVYEGIDTWQDVADWVEIEVTPKEGRYIKIQINATEGGSPGAIQFGQGGGSPITIFDAYSASTSSDPVLATLTGTANQITVTNGAGSIILSTPQNIHVGATPTFNTVTVTNKFKLGGGAIIEYDSESRNIPLKLSDDAGASIIDIQDSASNTVAYIDSDGDALFGNTFALSLETNSLTVNGVAVATGFTIGANTLTTSEFVYLDGQDQTVDTTSSPTFVGATLANYAITQRANLLIDFQNKDSGELAGIELFTKDGDTTDACIINIFGRGTPAQLTNIEYLQIGWSVSNSRYDIRTIKSGTGSAQALALFTDTNTNQLFLSTNGNVGINDNLPGEKLDVAGNTNVTGVYKVDDVQVIGNQQAHIADATTQDLTGTDTIDQTKLESDLAEIVAAIAALNLMAETHGLIASS